MNCSITIDGKPVDLKFGMTATKMFAERAINANFYDSQSLNEIGIASLLHCAYINKCIVTEKEAQLQLSDFVDYVEACALNQQTEEIQKVVAVWRSSPFIVASLRHLKSEKEKTVKPKSKPVIRKKAKS